MREAKILVARYKKGIMTKEQVSNYVKTVFISKYDKDAAKYVMDNIKQMANPHSSNIGRNAPTFGASVTIRRIVLMMAGVQIGG